MVLSAAVQAAEAAASSGQRLDLEFAQTMRSIDRALKAVRIDRHVRIRGQEDRYIYIYIYVSVCLHRFAFFPR